LETVALFARVPFAIAGRRPASHDAALAVRGGGVFEVA
jgi:hypothetical protein